MDMAGAGDRGIDLRSEEHLASWLGEFVLHVH